MPKEIVREDPKMIGETFEPGKPTEPYDWRKKLQSRDEILKYIQTGLRYWYSSDWYGSEKRKTPA
ncbi:TPA: hypothetical protein ENG04_11940 [Candidatus Poribacteria bacterium]|nr:hypothetical protein [Candidatus Poribacteria bacterium]HEX30779.1 hypothetical protein [Candidatus Poribacteria bacterium]